MSIDDDKVINFTEYVQAKRGSGLPENEQVSSIKDSSLTDKSELIRALFLDVVQERSDAKPARKSDRSLTDRCIGQDIKPLLHKFQTLLESTARLLNSMQVHSFFKKNLSDADIVSVSYF